MDEQHRNLTDDERERLIEITGMHAQQGSPAWRLYWWSAMKLLINGRSSTQIAKMEAAKGLSRAA